MTVKRFALVVMTASALVIGGAVALPDHACDSKDKAATTASATAEAPAAQTADLKAADKPGCAKPCDKAAMAAKGENAPCHKDKAEAAAVTASAEGTKAPCAAAAKAAGAGCPKKAAATAVVAQNTDTEAEAKKAPEAK